MKILIACDEGSVRQDAAMALKTGQPSECVGELNMGREIALGRPERKSHPGPGAVKMMQRVSSVALPV